MSLTSNIQTLTSNTKLYESNLSFLPKAFLYINQYRHLRFPCHYWRTDSDSDGFGFADRNFTDASKPVFGKKIAVAKKCVVYFSKSFGIGSY